MTTRLTDKTLARLRSKLKTPPVAVSFLSEELKQKAATTFRLYTEHVALAESYEDAKADLTVALDCEGLLQPKQAIVAPDGKILYVEFLRRSVDVDALRKAYADGTVTIDQILAGLKTLDPNIFEAIPGLVTVEPTQFIRLYPSNGAQLQTEKDDDTIS